MVKKFGLHSCLLINLIGCAVHDPAYTTAKEADDKNPVVSANPLPVPAANPEVQPSPDNFAFESGVSNFNQPGTAAVGVHNDTISYPSSVAVSPNGKSIYVCSYWLNTLTVLSGDTPGKMSEVEIHADVTSTISRANKIANFRWPSRILVTPDGASVYVSTYFNVLMVFARNLETGRLTFVESIQNIGAVPSTQPRMPTEIGVSPDSTEIYYTTPDAHALTIFSRRQGNQLRRTGVYSNATGTGVATISAIKFPANIMASPDGRNILLSSASTLDSTGGCLLNLARTKAGTLFLKQVFCSPSEGEGFVIPSMTYPAEIQIHPNNAIMFLSDLRDGKLHIFSRDRADGTLVFNRTTVVAPATSPFIWKNPILLSPRGDVLLTGSVSLNFYKVNSETGDLELKNKYSNARSNPTYGTPLNGLRPPFSLATDYAGSSYLITAQDDHAVLKFSKL